MNKHDFYKELMSEYSFDTEKIKANAKRGRFARQKIAPLTIGITAAVAACTVAVGTLAVTMLDNNNGVSLVDNSSTLSAKSDTERLKDAMTQLEQEKESNELKDMLITFAGVLSPAEVRDVLTAYTDGSVPIKALYFADGTRATVESAIGDVFSSNTAQITGAAINCSGITAAELAADSRVYLVELMSQADIDTVLPVDVESLAGEDIIDIKPEVSDTPAEPEISDTPVSSVEPVEPVQPSVPSEPVEPIEPGEPSEPTEPSQPDDTSASGGVDITTPTEDTTSEPADSSDNTDVPDTSEPEDTTQSEDEPDEPEAPAELTAAVLPEGVQLPVRFEAVRYETVIPNAESAFFIDEYIMYVKRKDGFGIYSSSLGSVEEIASVDCADAVIHWISQNGENMLVSGKGDADSSRTKLWLVNSENRSIVDLEAEDSVMDGSLVGIGYNEVNGLLVLNIREEGMSYLSVYRMDSNGSREYVGDPFQTSAKLTLMCTEGSNVYVAAQDGSLTQIIACNIHNGDTRIIGSYDNDPDIIKNYAFTHAVISPSDNALTGVIEVFDPVTENFVRTDYYGEDVYFGISRHGFGVNNRFYTVSNGIIVPTENIGVKAQVEFRKSLSSAYMVTGVNKEYITISQSVYSKANRDAALAYSVPAASSTDAQKQAFIGALGVNNALALGKCKESGLTKPEKLISAIESYYSAEVAQSVISRCQIERFGVLGYSDGGLTAINADDCVLVVSEQGTTSASGVVYIKAGTIGGKTAYRSVDISFTAENGMWKLDSLLS